MNRIVLIGNGFDLAHGLKSKYEHFINDYWAENCHSQKSAIHFLNHIREKSNLLNWVDIEDEYYKFLCYLLDKKRFSGYYYGGNARLNSDFVDVKHKLEKYLIKQLTQTTIRKHKKIYEILYSPFYLNDFSEDAKTYIVKKETEKILEYYSSLSVDLSISPKTVPLINSNFSVIETILKRKFKGIDFTPKYMRLSQKDYESLNGFLNLTLTLKEVSEKYFDLVPDDYMFLNFNYTGLEKLYIDVSSKEIPLDVHIHGELNNTDNPIIFGYGDELEENYIKMENLQDNTYLENIKSIKYLETNNYKNMLNFINSDKYQIIILGHSCGNSDRTLLNTLFEHENCVSIKPYYYLDKDNKDNYSDIVRNISRSFTDKKSMRDKVVNKTFCDWFSREQEQ